MSKRTRKDLAVDVVACFALLLMILALTQFTDEPQYAGPSKKVLSQTALLPLVVPKESASLVESKPRRPAGFAFAIGAKKAYSRPPIPNCKRKQMLARKKTICVKDPAFIPVKVPTETLRLVNSNIKYDLSTWTADFRKILNTKPDFITLQEMASRSDEELAIEGYAVYRSHEHTYTKETPVMWNTDRWELMDSGTKWLTVRKVKWGERAVNWVTLESKTTGRVVSIVSAHPAPTVKFTQGLLPIFMRGLYPLVETLHDRGEVLIGGDFNVQYQSALYREAGIPESKLVPTFDHFGKMPTGRYRGGTIDYMFYRQSQHLTPTVQGKWLQNSDHNALWSEWELSSPVKMLPRKANKAVLEHAGVAIPYS